MSRYFSLPLNLPTVSKSSKKKKKKEKTKSTVSLQIYVFLTENKKRTRECLSVSKQEQINDAWAAVAAHMSQATDELHILKE